uniref:Uncharacterized protein n=1 Tax=Siphoviridae sp. cteoh1 TaxID=2826407 RepID=A0A8S5QKK1_9CAUD|nr:MAG TPA: hypothetical protein [Siphoviridae sp. cteoh1]
MHRPYHKHKPYDNLRAPTTLYHKILHNWLKKQYYVPAFFRHYVKLQK